MYLVLSLTAGLLLYTGEFFVHGQPEKVVAFVGKEVILPCSFNISPTDDFPSVEWSREDLEPDIVFLFRGGCETYEMKNLLFQYRTSLNTKELKNGVVSLRISDVRLSDAGTFQCKRLGMNPPQKANTVELIVVAVSEPMLSLVPANDGGVALQCDATCWLPRPEVTFLDDQDNEIPAEEPREAHVSRCYNVRRTVTLQRATSRITCRVHQPEFNFTKNTKMFIPAHCMTSNLVTIIIVGVTASICIVASGLAVVAWRKCDKCAGGKMSIMRQGSDESTNSGSSESQFLLHQKNPVDRVDSGRNNTIKQLERKVADLESTILKQQNTICQLQTNSPPLAVACQHDQPTISSSPSKSSMDVLNPLNPDPQSQAKPKPAAATNKKPPKSGNVPKNKPPKRGIQRQNSIPAPGGSVEANTSPESNSSSPVDHNPTPAASTSNAPQRSEILPQGEAPKRGIQRQNSIPAHTCLFKVYTSPEHSSSSAADHNPTPAASTNKAPPRSDSLPQSEAQNQATRRHHSNPARICSFEMPTSSGSPSELNLKPLASVRAAPPNSGNLPQSKPPTSNGSSQNGDPALGRPIQRKHRNSSSPILGSLSFSVASISSSAEPVPNGIGQRRFSSVVPVSPGFQNRYSLLAHLTEE